MNDEKKLAEFLAGDVCCQKLPKAIFFMIPPPPSVSNTHETHSIGHFVYFYDFLKDDELNCLALANQEFVKRRCTFQDQLH